MKPILGFFGEYRWLSNFHTDSVVIGELSFCCSEQAYMWYKTDSLQHKAELMLITSPKDIKAFGRTVPLKPYWNELHRDNAMCSVILHKFMNPVLKTKLLETGDAYLEETNTWNDCYWGVCKGVGQNKLGQILMHTRSLYRDLYNSV